MIIIMESKPKGEVAVINRILTSMLMILAMPTPAVLLLLPQFSSPLVRAAQQSGWYLQQLFEPGRQCAITAASRWRGANLLRAHGF
jgi:hypothetical protein